MSKFTGKWLLDEVDIYETYGAIVMQGSYESLLSAPKRKEPLKNNWREEDGEEVDLELARYEAKEVSINFAVVADKTEFWAKRDAFLAALKADGEREFTVTPLSKVFKIYYKESSDHKLSRNTESGRFVETFTVKFGMNLQPVPQDVDPPAAPSNLAYDSVTSGSFRLTWVDNSDNEEGFEVLLSKSSTFATGNFTRVAGINAQQLIISGLEANTTYYAKVRAYNKLRTQFSAYTSQVQVSTSQAQVPTPSGFVVVAGNGRNTLSWNPVSIAQGYVIEYHSGDSNWTEIDSYDGVTAGFVHEGLMNGTTYYYRLSATAAGYANSSYTTAFATPTGETGGGGGGHVIADETQDLPQRSKLQFIGATVTDDEANDQTVVTIDSGGGAGTFDPVQDLTALQAIDTTDSEVWKDKWAILVEDEGAWYRLDRDSSVAETLPYIVAPTAGSGRWIQDQYSQMQGKVDKVGGDNQLEVTISTPSTWYGAATQMLRAAIQKIHDYINNSVFKVSDVDVSDISEGQYKLPLVQKVDGAPKIQGSSGLIDKLASSTVLAMLGDNANWGNVPGKSGDFIKLTGDNSLGQLGENSQELYDDEGQYFLCVSHIIDNPGEAVWVRNRSRDSLRIGVTQDDAVIAAIENETDWNTTTNTKIITTRSKPGSWHKSDVTGYLYHCYKEADSNADGIPDQWYWYRSGLPATEAMQVLNTGDYTGLVTALGAHDWSTGAYDPSGLTGEKGTQGQEYYDVANRKLYKCVFDAVNAKLVWEQINLVKA